MKKIIFLLLFIPAICFSQKSDLELQFDEYEQQGYSKMQISFGGKYNEELWSFRKGDQRINFTPDDLIKAAQDFEKGFNKAVEWDSIADANNVEKLNKEIPFNFITTKGMLEDAGFEVVGPKKGDFKFERFIMDNKTYSYFKSSVWQNGEYNVRSAFFSFPSVDVRNPEEVEKFKKFLDFMKSNKTIVEEKIVASKSDLFN